MSVKWLPCGQLEIIQFLSEAHYGATNQDLSLYLMHDGISFDKILPKQVGYLWTRIK
jgi:hypothetical protein